MTAFFVYREKWAIDRCGSYIHTGMPCGPRLRATPKAIAFAPKIIAPRLLCTDPPWFERISVLAYPWPTVSHSTLNPGRNSWTDLRIRAAPKRGPALDVPVTNLKLGPNVFSPITPAIYSPGTEVSKLVLITG